MHFNSKQHFILYALLSLLILFMSGTTALANSVTATGQGNSRQAAIQDAMRNAVETEVGVMLDSKTIFENYRIIEDSIYSRAEGFVRTYDIVGENAQNGVYQITINAIVDKTLDVELMNRFQKIKAVETGLQDPRIGVIIADSDTYDDESETAENTIIKALLSNGFSRLIDTKQVDRSRKLQIASALLHNNTEEAVALVSQFPVDYMIVGDVESSAQRAQSKGFSSFISGRAVINYRIFNMNTGEIAYADTADASVVANNAQMAKSKAVTASANKAGTALVNGLLSKATNPLQTMQVMVNTGHSMSEVKNLLQSISGVQQTYLRDSIDGFMIIDINYYGSSEVFAGELERRNIVVTEVSSKQIKLQY